MLLVHPLEELLLEFSIDGLRVHKVAETSALARPLLILTTFGLSEVSHGGILRHDHPPAVVSSIHAFHSLLCLLLVMVLHVEVADHVVTDVVSDDHLFDLAKLRHLHKHFLVEGLEVLDSLDEVLLWDVSTVGEGDRRIWVLIHCLEAHGLAKGWLVMDSSARVSVPTRADFEVEGTVDFVLFSTKDAL